MALTLSPADDADAAMSNADDATMVALDEVPPPMSGALRDVGLNAGVPFEIADSPLLDLTQRKRWE